MARTVDIEAFIDERPISSYPWLLVGLCSPVVMADGMDVAIMALLAILAALAIATTDRGGSASAQHAVPAH